MLRDASQRRSARGYRCAYRAAMLLSMRPKAFTRPALDRHSHRLEGGIAIDEVDALLHDAEARALAPQPVMLAAGKHALRLVAVLDHDHGRAHEDFALGRVGVFDDHVADEMRGARGRRLHVAAGMVQALAPASPPGGGGVE